MQYKTRLNTISKLAAAATFAALTASCGGLNTGLGGAGDRNDSDASAVHTGCVQGIVIDGISGRRLDVTAVDAGQGISALVTNRLVAGRATTIAADPERLLGEYVLCGVPLDGDFPLFARFQGYQAFEGTIRVDSTAPALTSDAETDITVTAPTRTANIRLFPLTAAKDFVVAVHNAGKGVNGATVTMRPLGFDAVEQGSNEEFLLPAVYRAATLSLTTDKNGNAAFTTAKLMLGGRYEVAVIPPDDLDAAAVGSRQVTVGLQPAAGVDPYRYFVDLETIVQPFTVQSTSLVGRAYSLDGSVTYVFSRDIQLAPGSENNIHVSLDKAVDAKLVADDANTLRDERVSVSVKGNRLRLAPVFKVEPRQGREPGLSVAFSGVAVSPKAGHDLGRRLTLSPRVSVFGGVAQPAAATALRAMAGDGQLGSVGQQLPQALAVQVDDQYGQPMPGAVVAFQVMEGGGSLYSSSVASDSYGRASVVWSIGRSGTQRVVAKLPNGSAVQFSAGFLPAATVAVVSGNNQAALVGEALTSAVVARVADRNGYPVTDTVVEVSLDDAVNGGLIAATLGGVGSTSLRLRSSASGDVSFYWTVGMVAGTYTARIKDAAGVVTPVTVTARAAPLAPTQLLKSDGDGQTGDAGEELDAPLVVQVLDQRQRPLAGVSVILTTANVGGTLTVGTTTAASVTAVTDENGLVEAAWKLGTTGDGATQTVTARVTGLTNIVFTAIAN
jgi:adhesin/invasin